MKRKINIIFIVIFILGISLPYLFAHRDKEGRISSMENRTLAAYPSIRTEEGGLNKGYLTEFEEWLNDNLRGRSLMVEVNSAMQYLLFERIVKSDTMMGVKPWLFVNEEDMIREYQRRNLLSEEELLQYTGKMQEISDYLKEQGIAFYYFQCYDKEEIYPEKYVKGINRIGTFSRADQIVQALAEKTDVNQILIKDTLLAHKEEMIYFQYVDLLHWNEKGSYYGYQALMERLRDDFPMIPLLREEDYNITQREETTEFYGFEYPYTESVPIYSVKEPQAREITEETQDTWDFLHVKEHTHEYSNESCENNLKILVLGDSFVRMFLKDDLAESFCATLSIDWANIPVLAEAVEVYQPDIVILESTQKALGNTISLVSQWEWPDR
ncbi:MAG: hypothetical protein NC314_06570 [Roseburia sp.]|nr:hypothetical protein [Roseburia sp.]MCM1242489.1 hypothetical protein [Roseburia sp.]